MIWLSGQNPFNHLLQIFSKWNHNKSVRLECLCVFVCVYLLSIFNNWNTVESIIKLWKDDNKKTCYLQHLPSMLSKISEFFMLSCYIYILKSCRLVLFVMYDLHRSCIRFSTNLLNAVLCDVFCHCYNHLSNSFLHSHTQLCTYS